MCHYPIFLLINMNSNASHTNNIQILEVESKQQLKQFIQLPNKIYQDDSTWISPLFLERKMMLSEKMNPYFKHAEWQAWIALKNGEVVGRISAQIDHLHLERYQDKTGFFGMLEAENDTELFRTLLETAEKWLLNRGINRIRGPFNLSINEEMGLLIDGFNTPPVFMMGHAKPYYLEQIETAGYTKAVDTIAYMMSPDFKAPPVMKRLLTKLESRINVRPINLKNFAEEMAILRDIFNDAWSENWGFVPFTKEEFHELGQNLKFLVASEMIQIAEVDGEPAAFIVALPNINEAIKDFNGHLFPFGLFKLIWRLKIRYPDSARVPLMGVRKQFQNTRLGPALAFLVIDSVRVHLVNKGATKIELSWILENNDGMRNIIETIGGDPYKKYRVLEKSIS